MDNGGFEECWSEIQRQLAAGNEVRNWTHAGGYLGDQFTVRKVDQNIITVEALGALHLQRIPKADFAAIYKHWDEYCAGLYPRHRIRDISRFSKYVISIIHHISGE